MASNVVVNLNINANASGTIDIFGQATLPTITGNVIVATNTLPVSDLYVSSSNSLIKFQGSNNDILATRDATFTTMPSTFLTDLSAIISGSFDCSNAQPYSISKYNNLYNTQTNFGHVVLGCYADKLFGHLAATAAVYNDTALINYITSNGVGGANISSNLVNSIFNMSDTNATAIAKQVIGQDASRAMNQDNDIGSPSTQQALKFIAGDVIYMSATIQPPTITSSAGQQSIPVNYSGDTTYLMKITLANPLPAAPPADLIIKTASWPFNTLIPDGSTYTINYTSASYDGYKYGFSTYDENNVDVTQSTTWTTSGSQILEVYTNYGDIKGLYSINGAYLGSGAATLITVSRGSITKSFTFYIRNA